MTNTNVLDTLKLIKDNYDKILKIEGFSIFDYNPFDMSSYDDEKKTFDEDNKKGKKDVKEDPFFTPTKSTQKKETKKCTNDIFDTSCNTGLKLGIWLLIIFTLIFIGVFIWYIFHKMSANNNEPTSTQPPEQLLQSKSTSQYTANPEKPSFIGRIFGSRSSTPDMAYSQSTLPAQSTPLKPSFITPDTQQDKDNFMSRLVGSRQQLPRKEKESFAKRLFN